MHVRDAREADADALATIADSPTDVMRNLVHDRTVRVAEDEAAASDVDASNGRFAGSDPEDILGFVSFDARDEVVYVTQIDGTPEACRRLLDEPIAFAEHESMSVEALVTTRSRAVTDALSDHGFDERGRGPRFEGAETVRFRLEP
ncbi:hypothetical protein [Halovivax sp.]|uniref:hypothetical protein n=1 Tax=Halovivax sp. TaxID=1935978 RepID=UPI0025C46F30|nr:hypothetical protein [Halovivax sp.]